MRNILISIILWTQGAAAQLIDGNSGANLELRSAVGQLLHGQVVLIGENHGFLPHYENQRRLLDAIAEAGFPVSVGLEFFQKRFQNEVNEYLAGNIAEDSFLKLIEWTSPAFSNYRDQAWFPRLHDGRTLALNASRLLTRKVSQQGLESLTENERRELPDGFTLGNALYYERFRETMKQHVPEEALTRYFSAQSIWDEVMADTACQFIKGNPDQLLVIIVGDFHVAYGGGLPDRVRARGCDPVIFSQINASGLTKEELEQEANPHPKYGKRGDFVWISRE